ncbi:hypothetical protein [Nocardioides convexus]|uniref:hypothetical protein n=1 Tax=Nocardioides convexus TaxID=2712224 RepID=UPI0024188F6D|nr:hypothetical protein [Nocardioides convexus]
MVTATLVAGAVAMPISGRLGDLFGKQRVLVVSAVLLVLGSLVCALSRLARPDARRPGAAGLRDGLHPGRHRADARGRPAAVRRHRHGGDERDPRRGRCHRPAVVGVDRAGLQVAHPVLGLHRARRPGRGRRDRARPARARRRPRPLRRRRRGRPRPRPGRPARGRLQGQRVGLGARAHHRTARRGRRGAPRLGQLRVAGRGPAVRPPRHLAPPGAADQRRGHRDRLRDDGPGHRRPAVAAVARGDRLRPGPEPARDRPVDGPRRTRDDGLLPGLGSSHRAARRASYAHDRGGRARPRLRLRDLPH